MKNLLTILEDWILDQNNPYKHIKLARAYFDTTCYSASYTHYLAALDTLDPNNFETIYECLCMLSQIHFIEGNRWSGACQYARLAKTIMPDRPEAYYLLSKVIASKLYTAKRFEQGDWVEVYENAKIGSLFAKVNDRNISLYYDGIDYLYLLYMESCYRLGKRIELIDALKSISFKNPTLDIIGNYNIICSMIKLPSKYITYTSEKSDSLKYKFNNLELVDTNYSESMQDMFVLTALNGKLNGSYLELGSAEPEFSNNTKLLEDKFNWKGVSIEYNEDLVNQFRSRRTNPVIYANALELDYANLLEDCNEIDYLQVDLDPATVSLEVMIRLPFDKVKFNVITFEHDLYRNNSEVKSKSIEFLTSKGYVLVGENIKSRSHAPYEDWWVHKDVFESNPNLKDMFNNTDGLIYNIFYK